MPSARETGHAPRLRASEAASSQSASGIGPCLRRVRRQRSMPARSCSSLSAKRASVAMRRPPGRGNWGGTVPDERAAAHARWPQGRVVTVDNPRALGLGSSLLLPLFGGRAQRRPVPDVIPIRRHSATRASSTTFGFQAAASAWPKLPALLPAGWKAARAKAASGNLTRNTHARTPSRSNRASRRRRPR
jgi:hypothetical protein